MGHDSLLKKKTLLLKRSQASFQLDVQTDKGWKDRQMKAIPKICFAAGEYGNVLFFYDAFLKSDILKATKVLI